jgi:signal peptidase I
VTERPTDDDWVSETLARAMLEGDQAEIWAQRPDRPTPTDPPRWSNPAAADVGPRSAEPGPPLLDDDQPSAAHTNGSTVGAPPPDGPTTDTPPIEASPGGAAPGLDGPRADERPPTDATPPAPAEPESAGHRSGAEDDEGSSHSALRSLVEWVLVIAAALAVALVLRALLFQAYWIPSESMEPTLQRDDRVLVNRLSYRLHDVNRGDVIVFARPPGEPDTGIADLIKRVVGLSGETIEARDGMLYVDGRLLIEGYTADGPPFMDFGPIEVPEGHVFVMGDNRNNSRDSRYFSAIDEDSIVGRAFVLFWPLNRIGLL